MKLVIRIKDRLGEILKAKLKKKYHRLKKFLILAGIVFLLVTYFGGDFGFIRLSRLGRQKKELQLRSKKLDLEILQLEVEKGLLQKDAYYVEKIAREKHGLSRPDEKVYRFLPPSEDSSLAP